MEYKRRGKEKVENNTFTGLTEGRIVHYVAYNNRHLAAIVIGVGEEYPEDLGKNACVDLALFTNMPNVSGTKNYGLQFHSDISFDPKCRPGTWHWIERKDDKEQVKPLPEGGIVLSPKLGIVTHNCPYASMVKNCEFVDKCSDGQKVSMDCLKFPEVKRIKVEPANNLQS